MGHLSQKTAMNQASFITDNLKDIIAAGPALGALENKLKALEGINKRVGLLGEDVREALKPLPKPKVIVKKPPPAKPKPIKIVIDDSDSDDDALDAGDVKKLKKVMDKKK